jgi:hypothetical protein
VTANGEEEEGKIGLPSIHRVVLPRPTVCLARIDDGHGHPNCSHLPSEMKSGPHPSSRTEECQDEKVQVKMEEDEEPEEIKLEQLKASEIEHLIQGIFSKAPSTSVNIQLQGKNCIPKGSCLSVYDSRNEYDAEEDIIQPRTTRLMRKTGTPTSREKYFEPNSSIHDDDEKKAVVLKRDAPKRKKKNHDKDFKAQPLRCSSSERSCEHDNDEERFEKHDADYDNDEHQRDGSLYHSTESSLSRPKETPRKPIKRHKLGSDEPIPCFLCQVEFGDYKEYDAVRRIDAHNAMRPAVFRFKL